MIFFHRVSFELARLSSLFLAGFLLRREGRGRRGFLSRSFACFLPRAMQCPVSRCAAVASTSGSAAAAARAPPPSSRRCRRIHLLRALFDDDNGLRRRAGGFSFFLGDLSRGDGDDFEGAADEDERRQALAAAASGWEDFDDVAAPTSPSSTSPSSAAACSSSSDSSRPPPTPPPPPPTGWEPSAESLRRAAAASSSSSSSKRRRRRATPRGPRDEFVRPIIDPFGVGLRLGPDPSGAEEDLGEELEANRGESAAAGAFLATALGCCAAAGFAAGHVVVRPVVAARAAADATFLSPTPAQRAEGGRAVQERQAMLRLEAAVGKLPPGLVDEDALLLDARAEAASLAAEFRERNERGIVDLAQDSTAALVLFLFLALPSEGRAAFFGAFGRIFSGLSDTAKAFLIIASTDIFLGYHSEEGWTAAIHLLTGHYNVEPDERGVAFFIATVPVVADAFFKLWIFKGLNRANPSAAVTLKEMDKN